MIKLKPRKRYDIAPLVGIDGQLYSAMKSLDIQSGDDVRYIGIHGMGGIGKTTLAKFIFNKISAHFDCSTFLENVREVAAHHGIEYLQETLLNGLGPKLTRQLDLHEKIKKSFCKRKVLIFLDDVDGWEQIKKLAGKSTWFGSGSRIVVTTRDKDVLAIREEKLNEDDVWHLEMGTLNLDDALRLFSRYAFQKESPPHAFRELSEEAVSVTGGLPLALIVIGSLLHNKDSGVWKDIIDRSKRIPLKEVKERMRISYDNLEHEQKQIFLEVAYFFIDTEKTKPLYMWEACEYYPRWALAVLCSRSLVKISDNDRIWIHDQLRDLGRDLVREESLNNPKKRSRIWVQEEAVQVLMSKEENENPEGLRLNCPVLEGYRKPNDWRLKRIGSIGSLTKLRFLDLGMVSFSTSPQVTSVKSGKDGANCSILFFVHLQNAKNLKVIDLTEAKRLERTPNFPTGMTLERLILARCWCLVAIDSSIGNLRCLSFPNSIHNLVQLKCIKLNNLDLGNFVHSLGALSSLVELDLKGTDIRKLPDAIEELKLLVELDLGSTRIIELPQSIGGLQNLKLLLLKGCEAVKALPDSIGGLKSLVRLDLSGTRIIQLPDSIGGLDNLKLLFLKGCEAVKALPDSVGGLKSLVKLDLSGTGIIQLPDSIGRLQSLEEVYLTQCKQLRELPQSFGALGKLEKLDAQSTDLSKGLPSELSGLSSLRSMDHSRSRVHQLPPSIIHLSHLQTLKLQGCFKLKDIPDLPPSLTLLDLRSNSQKEGWLLSNLTKLTNMKVEGHLYLDGIGSLHSLTKLELRLWSITTIPTEFGSLSQLKKLVLDCPKLNHVPEFPPNLEEMQFRATDIETAEEEAHTLESILVSGDRDFVITNGGAKVQVSDLLGKNILLYLSAFQSSSCHILLPKVVQAYHENKAKDEAFEVIFIPIERDHATFEQYFSRMPWLALPFGDQRISSLLTKLEIRDVPELVALGPNGQIITKEGRSLLEAYGMDTYPFTDDHIEDMDMYGYTSVRSAILVFIPHVF
ncbi:disease resistance protein TAO1-like [Punica granatum]|uniref:Disease resistance protein TAO1-like n=1 Tax=Punica granatum TaxID=22663 RepID=A0A6P8C760_PUNGR|nr:disease resistance protein TAO1-like [Punica granatum]